MLYKQGSGVVTGIEEDNIPWGRPIKYLDIAMSHDETQALTVFNHEMCCLSTSGVNIDFARFRAVNSINAQYVKDLARAFHILWPHWFTNGRSELAEGSIEEARKVCHEIVNKIRPPKGVSVSSQLGILATMGGMRLVNVGGRRGGAVARTENSTRRGIREVMMCEYHPEKRSVGDRLCARCYSRRKRIESVLNVDAESLPHPAFREIMIVESPQDNPKNFLRPFIKEVVKRYNGGSG